MLLRSISIANLIEKKLNELGSAKSYTFRVFDSVGDNKPSNDIKCVLHQFKGDLEPLKNHIDIDYGYVLEMAIPTANANDELIAVREIVDELLIELNASSVALDGGNCLFNFSTTTPKDYKMEFGLGDITPIAFTINVRYTQNAITSYDKHWLLDGVEIPFLKEMVTLNKEGTPNKINKDNYAKALITGQAKYYKFDFQYNTDDPISVGLQKDILQGEFEKTYTLTYYDGVAFTQDNPFTSLVTIFRDANSSVERTQTGIFSVTFTDFDDNVNAKYYLALIDTPFDLQEKNTRYFEATADKTAEQVQQEYYANKITNGGADYELIKAPNLNSLDITSQIYRNVRNYDLFDLMNKNYAVIKVERENKPTRYFYYFITQSNIGAGNQITCDLKLDSIQTYMFNSDLKIADCLIRKAHLDRFKIPEEGEDDPNHIYFNLETDSPFYESDSESVKPMMLENSKDLEFKIFYQGEGNDWYLKNVLGWVYLYLDDDLQYKSYNAGDFTDSGIWKGEDFQYSMKSQINRTGGEYKHNYAVICYPIFRNDKASINIVNKDKTKILKLNSQSYLDFLKLNETLIANLYNAKISIKPPFDSIGGAEVVGDSLNITLDNYNDVYLPIISVNNRRMCLVARTSKPTGNVAQGIIIGVNDFAKPLWSTPITFISWFNKETLINNSITPDKFYKYNPKLLSSKFQVLRIVDSVGNHFDYDIQKLLSAGVTFNRIDFIYNEKLQPETTHSYLRLDVFGYNGCLYSEFTNRSYLGLVSNVDNGVELESKQYANFLANNKNFALSSLLSAGENIAGGAIGGALLGKGPLGVATGLAAAGKSLISQHITLDNMKNTPDTISNASGSVLFNAVSRETLQPRVEKHICTINDMQVANMKNMLYGYEYNRIGNIKDFINVRKYYNYIEAEVDAIDGVAMSNTARENIRQRFESGVRFWNNDNIDYDKFNYEKKLEN